MPEPNIRDLCRQEFLKIPDPERERERERRGGDAKMKKHEEKGRDNSAKRKGREREGMLYRRDKWREKRRGGEKSRGKRIQNK